MFLPIFHGGVVILSIITIKLSIQIINGQTDIGCICTRGQMYQYNYYVLGDHFSQFFHSVKYSITFMYLFQYTISLQPVFILSSTLFQHIISVMNPQCTYTSSPSYMRNSPSLTTLYSRSSIHHWSLVPGAFPLSFCHRRRVPSDLGNH